MKVAETRLVEVDRLKPYPGNPRRHDQTAIRESLERNGQYRAVVVRKSGLTILAGHGTVEGARELGLPTVLAHLVTCSAAEAKRIVAADNRTSDLGRYDDELLAQMLTDLGDLTGTGYDDDDLAKMLRSLEDAGPGRETDPGLRPSKPETTLGQIITLGDHRLLCGDATDTAAMARLMDGDLANLIFTDPPWGVDYAGGRATGQAKREKHTNDHAGTTIYADFMPALLTAIRPDAALYIFFAAAEGLPVYQALTEANWTIRSLLVWNKTQANYGAIASQYKQRHEVFLYCVRRSPKWYGKTNEVSVWDVEKPKRNEHHPTQKPIALAERAIRNSSKAGDVVLDPFGGSGSTLIAAENLGRRCCMMELDPGYCDVIIDRWERHTGRKAARDGG